MRTALSLALIPCLVMTLLAGRETPPADASAVLAAAREALGGEARLAAVKSFVATGRTRQVRGNSLVPIEFEVSCELPDKYVRKDEVPAQESAPTTSGFNGDRLVQVPGPEAAPPKPGGPGAAAGPTTGPAAAAPDPRTERVAALKQDFVRLTLGMFATSFPSYPLTFALVGRAEAPQGKADIVEVRGPGTFLLKLFINSDTHLPIMASWTVPAPKGAAPGTLVEHRLYYADYREVGNGLRFPFRLRRSVAGETTEETNFDGFQVNRRIDVRRFEPVK